MELDSGALKHCQPLVLLCYFSFFLGGVGVGGVGGFLSSLPASASVGGGTRAGGSRVSGGGSPASSYRMFLALHRTLSSLFAQVTTTTVSV